MKLKLALILNLLFITSPLFAAKKSTQVSLQEALQAEKQAKYETVNVSEGKQIVESRLQNFTKSIALATGGQPFVVKQYLGYVDTGYDFKEEMKTELKEDIKKTVEENQKKNGSKAKTVFILGGIKEGYGIAYEMINEMRANGEIKNVIVAGVADVNDSKRHLNNVQAGYKGEISSKQDILLTLNTEKAEGYRGFAEKQSPRVDLMIELQKLGASQITLSLLEGNRGEAREGLEFLEKINNNKKATLQLFVGLEPVLEKDRGFRASRDIINTTMLYNNIFNSSKIEVKLPGDNKVHSALNFVNSVESITLGSKSDRYRANSLFSHEALVKDVLEAKISVLQDQYNKAKDKRRKIENHSEKHHSYSQIHTEGYIYDSYEERLIDKEIEKTRKQFEGVSKSKTLPGYQMAVKEFRVGQKFFQVYKERVKNGGIDYFDFSKLSNLKERIQKTLDIYERTLKSNNYAEGPIKLNNAHFAIKENTVINRDGKIQSLRQMNHEQHMKIYELENRNKLLLETMQAREEFKEMTIKEQIREVIKNTGRAFKNKAIEKTIKRNSKKR